MICRRSMGCVQGEGALSLESGGVPFSLTWRKGREGKGSPVTQTDKGSPGQFVLVI